VALRQCPVKALRWRMSFRRIALSCALFVCLSAFAQEAQEDHWEWGHRLELRGDYRWSDNERFELKFPFPPEFLPPGQTHGFEATPDPGHHVEMNAAELQLDLRYGELFAARAKVHAFGLHRRNPTSSDRKADVDELFLRFGRLPDGLDRPPGTSFFAQIGKFPKMERQPIRMLESYGLAATAFNRFEDIQVLTGGTIGRSFYWRAQLANGNPLFFRDANALAGDNGTPELREPFPTPKYGSGFPILYNAETEGLAFESENLQVGEALGYRWQREDQSLGFDLIVFHYRRSLAAEKNLTGTFYGADLDLLDGVAGFSLPISGNTKEEYGSRLYAEWGRATAIAQFTKQNVAGLQREGWELETGYSIPVRIGPIEAIEPAARLSGLTNRFRGPKEFPAPSVWWAWTKIDGGIRLRLSRGFDVTAEYTTHNVGSSKKLKMKESLVTVRWRV
jgi:hypothetical protein